MFVIGRLCLRPRVDHFLRHCYPSDLAPLIDLFDSGLFAYASQAMNLPAHLHPGRFRHRVLAAEAAIYFESPNGLVRVPFPSSEGVQRGDPAASAEFA